MNKTYLCEKNLGTLLRVLFGEDNVKSQVAFKTKIIDSITGKLRSIKFVVDYTVEYQNHVYVVEFDGFRHFQSSKNQFRDLNLVQYCIENDIGVVQIPYFVQADARLFEYLFNIQFDQDLKDINHPKGFSEKVIESTPDIDWQFPHGFISHNCLRPSDFNIVGWRLFVGFYQNIMIRGDMWSIAQQIYHSLMNSNSQFPYVWFPPDIGKFSPSDFVKHYPT